MITKSDIFIFTILYPAGFISSPCLTILNMFIWKHNDNNVEIIFRCDGTCVPRYLTVLPRTEPTKNIICERTTYERLTKLNS